MSSTFGAFMSYCRQDGAQRAMAEALTQVEEYVVDNNQGAGREMSDSEVRAFKRNMQDIYHWMCDMCLIDGEFDEEELENICTILKGEEP